FQSDAPGRPSGSRLRRAVIDGAPRMLAKLFRKHSSPRALQEALRDSELVAIDVETTGLFPGGHDRVVELAIVRFTIDGEVLDEYETVLNPSRDLGPQRIHGLTMAELVHAPSFEDV